MPSIKGSKMENGRILKASVSLSVLVHVVALCALVFLVTAAPEKERVFFVELKGIELVPARPGPKAVKKPASMPSPQRVAKPEEKKIVKEIKKPVVDNPQAVEPEPLVDYEPSAVMYETEASAASEVTLDRGTAPSQGVSSAGETASPGTVLSASLDEGFSLASSGGPSRADFISRIRDAIQRELTYPLRARRRRLEGTVVAGFGIDSSGRPHDIEIVDSSGYKVLDEEVIKIILRASPYPYIPDRVEVPVSFRLVEGR